LKAPQGRIFDWFWMILKPKSSHGYFDTPWLEVYQYLKPPAANTPSKPG
jgi:hypothetical protein